MYCLHPKILTNKYTGERVFVPCAKCLPCQIQKQNILSLRVKNECLKHKYNIFFTLTYENSQIPYIRVNDHNIYRGFDHPKIVGTTSDILACRIHPNLFVKRNKLEIPFSYDSYGVLFYHDLQNFFKRLRNEIQERFNPGLFEKESFKLRYVVCGEYGFEKHRCHYHGIFHTNNEQVKNYLLTGIMQNWTFCNWEALRLADEKSLPSLIESDKGADYVSKYSTKFDSSFPLSEFNDFKPFVKYSKIPYYGLSTLDEEVIQQIITGSSLCLVKRNLEKSGKFVDIKSSPFLSDFLYGKSPKYIENFDERLVRDIFENSRDVTIPVRNFIQRIRKHCLTFFGTITKTHVFFFLTRLQDFRRKLLSDRLKDEMSVFNESKPLDYVKFKFQTLSAFYVDKSSSDALHELGVSLLDNVHFMCNRIKRLSRLFDCLTSFGVTLPILVDLITSSPSSFFDHEIKKRIFFHRKYIINKLL